MKIIIFAVLFFLNLLQMHSQYIWQNIRAQYRSVCQVSKLEVFIVGDEGTILKTTDGGNGYKRIDLSIRADLFSVDFSGLGNGIIVGDSGYVLTTQNGGNDWFIQKIGIERINSVKFVDSNTAYISNNKGEIFRSIDCGLNWDMIHSNGNIPINKITFSDQRNGFAICGNGQIIYSDDFGISWNAIYSDNSRKLLDVDFLDSQKGILLSYKKNEGMTISTTTDRGSQWVNTKIESSSETWCVKLLNDSSVIVLGENGRILRSHDFMQTYYEDTLTSYDFIEEIQPRGLTFISISTDNKGNLCAIGNQNSISFSQDSGITFKLKDWFIDRYINYYDIRNILYLNKNERLCMTSCSRVYKSVDAGTTWKFVFPILHNIHELNDSLQEYWWSAINELDSKFRNGYFFDDKKGFLLGYRHNSFKSEFSAFTNDGGINWIRNDFADALALGRFSDGSFITSGFDANIYRADPEGANWLKDSSYNDGGSEIPNIIIDSSDVAYFFRWQPSIPTIDTLHWPKGKKIGMTVFRSLDKGKTFDSVYSEEEYGKIWYKLTCDSEGNIYLIGKGGSILKSSDRCNTWVSLQAPFFYVRDLCQIGNDRLMVIADKDSVAFSSNSAITWNIGSLGISSAIKYSLPSLDRIIYLPDSSIFLLGRGRMIRGIPDKYTDVPLARKDIVGRSCLNISVSPLPAQNWVSVTISGIDQASFNFPTIKLYDLYGNLIVDFSSELIKAEIKDKMNFQISLENLNIGIYILVLNTGNNILTGKVIKF